MIGGRQFGAIGRPQLRALGATDEQIEWRERTGSLLGGPLAYQLPGWPDSFEQRLWAGYLALGEQSGVSQRAAGRVHGLMSMARVAGAELTIPHGAHRRLEGVIVHQSRAFDLLEFVPRPGLPPVTSVAQTLVDLSATTGRGALRMITEDAAIRRLVTYKQIDERLGVMAARGRRGIPRMASVLGSLSPGEPVPDSRLEADTLRLFDAHGAPRPRVHVPLPGRSLVKGVVDFEIEDAALLLETDGRMWHARIQQAKKDAERDHQAAKAGRQTLRFFYEHVVGDPEGTWNTIQEVRAVRRRLLAA